MLDILLIVQIAICFLVIIAILLQRSAGGVLGGVGSSGGGAIVSSKAANSFLHKVTIALVAIFIVNSIILGNLSNKKLQKDSVVNKIEKEDSSAPVSVPLAE
jgi:preprotein translocase subunit SecG